PYPGGWLLGGVMLVNLTAAHLVRFKLSWKRSGVILLHAGGILLMVGELVTGMAAVESTMTIRKGETTDFVDVTRDYAIAVTDRSDPKEDQVTVIPHHLFRQPGTVRDEQLPFDLEVTEYWKNTGEANDIPPELGGRGGVPFPAGTPDVFRFRFVPAGLDFHM